MGAEEFLKIEKTSKDELVGKQEIVIPAETQKEIDELKTTVRTLSRSNADLELRVERFEAHVQRMIAMEKKIDERLQAQDRIEWEK